jgi:hypothetical protein
MVFVDSDAGQRNARPKGRRDLDSFIQDLTSRRPFTFVRFSDGEMEILHRERLVLGPEGVTWSKGTSSFVYPVFDHKDFDPERDAAFQTALLRSARKVAPRYFKGIPTRHNRALSDRNLMVELNAGVLKNLTFADLLINGNFKRFRSEVLAEFKGFESVAVVGNFRMQPNLINSEWQLIPVPDSLIGEFPGCFDGAMEKIKLLPKGSLVLSSASSLTNILGAELLEIRPDLFFIDIGTALHDLMGMPAGIRSYQIQLRPWTLSNLKERVGYYLGGSHRLRW